MTNKEAIKTLHELWRTTNDPWYEKVYEMAINALTVQPETHEERTETHGVCLDAISRQAAIDALWKALYAYEDKTEKQFQESDELDVGDWFEHRIFVQNMNDIDRQTILHLPSAQPERPKDKWNFIGNNMFECTCCGTVYTTQQLNGLRNYDTDPYAPKFCPNCGADMRGEQDETD